MSDPSPTIIHNVGVDLEELPAPGTIIQIDYHNGQTYRVVSTRQQPQPAATCRRRWTWASALFGRGRRALKEETTDPKPQVETPSTTTNIGIPTMEATTPYNVNFIFPEGMPSDVIQEAVEEVEACFTRLRDMGVTISSDQLPTFITAPTGLAQQEQFDAYLRGLNDRFPLAYFTPINRSNP